MSCGNTDGKWIACGLQNRIDRAKADHSDDKLTISLLDQEFTPQILTLIEVAELLFSMRCGCGGLIVVDEHSNGYSMRCEKWIAHKQNPNGLKRN